MRYAGIHVVRPGSFLRLAALGSFFSKKKKDINLRGLCVCTKFQVPFVWSGGGANILLRLIVLSKVRAAIRV